MFQGRVRNGCCAGLHNIQNSKALDIHAADYYETCIYKASDRRKYLVLNDMAIIFMSLNTATKMTVTGVLYLPQTLVSNFERLSSLGHIVVLLSTMVS
jgi:hypothetical protein